jgi:hypothetical protein
MLLYFRNLAFLDLRVYTRIKVNVIYNSSRSKGFTYHFMRERLLLIDRGL